MAKMKSKSQLAEKDVQKMIQEYWETLESEQGQNDNKNRNPAVGVTQLKVSQ